MRLHHNKDVRRFVVDSAKGNGSSTGDPWEFDEPIYPTFFMWFDWDNSLFDQNYDMGEAHPTLLWENQQSGHKPSIEFLENIKEAQRSDYLRAFIDLLKRVETQYPWYFQKVSGIENFWKHEYGETAFEDEKSITIECLESRDMLMTSLADFYRKASFDREWMRYLLPINRRRFNMLILVHDFRRPFRIDGAKDLATSAVDASIAALDYANGAKNDNENAAAVERNVAARKAALEKSSALNTPRSGDPIADIGSALGINIGIPNPANIPAIGNIATQAEIIRSITSESFENPSPIRPQTLTFGNDDLIQVEGADVQISNTFSNLGEKLKQVTEKAEEYGYLAFICHDCEFVFDEMTLGSGASVAQDMGTAKNFSFKIKITRIREENIYTGLKQIFAKDYMDPDERAVTDFSNKESYQFEQDIYTQTVFPNNEQVNKLKNQRDLKKNQIKVDFEREQQAVLEKLLRAGAGIAGSASQGLFKELENAAQTLRREAEAAAKALTGEARPSFAGDVDAGTLSGEPAVIFPLSGDLSKENEIALKLEEKHVSGEEKITSTLEEKHISKVDSNKLSLEEGHNVKEDPIVLSLEAEHISKEEKINLNLERDHNSKEDAIKLGLGKEISGEEAIKNDLNKQISGEEPIPDSLAGEITSPGLFPPDLQGEITSPGLFPPDLSGEIISPGLFPPDLSGEITSPGLFPPDLSNNLDSAGINSPNLDGDITSPGLFPPDLSNSLDFTPPNNPGFDGNLEETSPNGNSLDGNLDFTSPNGDSLNSDYKGESPIGDSLDGEITSPGLFPPDLSGDLSGEKPIGDDLGGGLSSAGIFPPGLKGDISAASNSTTVKLDGKLEGEEIKTFKLESESIDAADIKSPKLDGKLDSSLTSVAQKLEKNSISPANIKEQNLKGGLDSLSAKSVSLESELSPPTKISLELDEKSIQEAQRNTVSLDRELKGENAISVPLSQDFTPASIKSDSLSQDYISAPIISSTLGEKEISEASAISGSFENALQPLTPIGSSLSNELQEARKIQSSLGNSDLSKAEISSANLTNELQKSPISPENLGKSEISPEKINNPGLSNKLESSSAIKDSLDGKLESAPLSPPNLEGNLEQASNSSVKLDGGLQSSSINNPSLSGSLESSSPISTSNENRLVFTKPPEVSLRGNLESSQFTKADLKGELEGVRIENLKLDHKLEGAPINKSILSDSNLLNTPGNYTKLDNSLVDNSQKSNILQGVKNDLEETPISRPNLRS